MKILLIDNYDSFTYNIVDALRKLEFNNVTVLKNDEASASVSSAFDKIIISPGPDIPSASGHILDVIDTLKSSHSILGICLGHQAIGQVFGAKLVSLPKPLHGHITHLELKHPHSIFPDDASIQVGLYHSWTLAPEEFPEELQITSLSAEGHIMSIQHKQYDVHGVQFHPESYMTPLGIEMIKRFLALP